MPLAWQERLSTYTSFPLHSNEAQFGVEKPMRTEKNPISIGFQFDKHRKKSDAHRIYE
jgi:hypothetical protein